MNIEIRDTQFALFVDELAETDSLADLSFAFGVVEAIGGAIMTVYEAFATPERGLLTLAAKGLLV